MLKNYIIKLNRCTKYIFFSWWIWAYLLIGVNSSLIFVYKWILFFIAFLFYSFNNTINNFLLLLIFVLFSLNILYTIKTGDIYDTFFCNHKWQMTCIKKS